MTNKNVGDFNKKYNKSFCIKPFTEYCNSTSNSLTLCCISDSYEKLDQDADLLDTFYNHQLLQNTREKMLKGKYIEECKSCYERERHKGISPRITYTNDMPLNIVEDAFAGNIELVSLDLKFGNVCNQGCVMCSPLVSSFLAKEQNKEAFLYNTENLAKLKNNAKNIIRFKTTGGEPMLQPGFEKSIDILLEHGSPATTDFITVTNGTVDICKLFTKMKKFKSFKVNYSLDAVNEETYKFVRYPGNFRKVKNNHIKLLDLIQKDLDDKKYDDNSHTVEITFNVTLHIFNIHEIENIAKYISDLANKYNVEITFMFDYVDEPEHQTPSLLDKNILLTYIKNAAKVLAQSNLIKEDVDNTISVLYSIAENCDYVENKQEKIDKLKEQIEYFKKIRKLDAYEIVPHLKSMLQR